MDVWIIDHYSVPIEYYPLARQRNFAKYLIKKGHNVTIFAASSVHNSSINLIDENLLHKEMFDGDIRYVLIKCHSYTGNGIKRIFNMLEFAYKLKTVCGEYKKPDIIISTSMTQFACAQGILMARKYGCKVIAQITDLWPETIVAWGLASRYNPIILALRYLEKWTYKSADKVIFSMEGAYNYIKEQGWESDIPEDKVHYINNGVDLEDFCENAEKYRIQDDDLKSLNKFKVIYTGSIRKDNNLDLLLDIAKCIKNPDVIFLVFGDGDELAHLKQRVKDEEILNVIFKGRVGKKYIPYIVKCADLNYAHNNQLGIFKYGISLNKIFDYFAAGKPIISDFYSGYNPIVEENAGINVESGELHAVADAIERIAVLPESEYNLYCANAMKAAQKYSFKNLTDRLEKIMFDLVQ